MKIKIEGNHPIGKRMDWNLLLEKGGQRAFETQTKEIFECIEAGYEITINGFWKNLDDNMSCLYCASNNKEDALFYGLVK